MLSKDNKYVGKPHNVLGKKSRFIDRGFLNLELFIRISSGLEIHISTLGIQNTKVNFQFLIFSSKSKINGKMHFKSIQYKYIS